MEDKFSQVPPQISNTYNSDFWFRTILKWRLPAHLLSELEPDLRRLGDLAAGPMVEWARQAESQIPQHVPFDSWGNRIDAVNVSPGWEALERIAAEQGLIATGYERRQGEFSRFCQLAKLYLYHSSSAFFSCPLAMTDGAARILELLATPELKEKAFSHLVSRNPKNFWTSGQWMTEKTGGSDVSDTCTVAKPDGNRFRLFGDKWFTSAVTAQMAMVLARIEGAVEGSRGLSLFYVEVRDKNGTLNNIEVHRLKDKLGTRALPTAELTMNGTIAELIGEPGQGVKNIATMLNITRLYNSVCAISHLRRGLALADDYSQKRRVFGRPLSEQPLQQMIMAKEKMHFVSGLLVTFHVAMLLGKEESQTIDEREKYVLRLITPLAKLYTGKVVVKGISEILEVFAGAGYVEDTGLPVLMRDAQVFPIWEGPTNVLSLDLLRVLQKPEAFSAFQEDIELRLKSCKSSHLRAEVCVVEHQAKQLSDFWSRQTSEDSESLQCGARDLAFSMTRLFSASLLLEFAEWGTSNLSAAEQTKVLTMAKLWCSQPLICLDDFNKTNQNAAVALSLS